MSLQSHCSKLYLLWRYEEGWEWEGAADRLDEMEIKVWKLLKSSLPLAVGEIRASASSLWAVICYRLSGL